MRKKKYNNILSFKLSSIYLLHSSPNIILRTFFIKSNDPKSSNPNGTHGPPLTSSQIAQTRPHPHGVTGEKSRTRLSISFHAQINRHPFYFATFLRTSPHLPPLLAAPTRPSAVTDSPPPGHRLSRAAANPRLPHRRSCHRPLSTETSSGHRHTTSPLSPPVSVAPPGPWARSQTNTVSYTGPHVRSP